MARLEEITNAKAIQDVKNLAKELKGVANASDELTLSQKELTQMVSKVVDSLKDETLKGKQLKEAKLALQKAAKESIALDNKLIKSEKDLLKIDDERIKQTIRNKQLLQEKTKAVKDEIKANKLVKGSIDDLRQTIKNLESKRNKLNVTTKKGQDAAKKYNEEIRKTRALILQNASANDKRIAGIGRYLKAMLQWSGITTIVSSVSTALAGLSKELYTLSKTIVADNIRSQTVFGKSLKYVEQRADKLAAKMGATTHEFIAMATATGDLLIPLGFTREEAAKMATQLQETTGPLHEWVGGSIEATEVSTILTKAMLGENEQLKRLGIAIRMDSKEYINLVKSIKKAQGVTHGQAQALATLQLIEQKSADARSAYNVEGNKLLRTEKELHRAWAKSKEWLVSLWTDSTIDKIQQQQGAVFNLVAELQNANTSEEQRVSILKRLSVISPTITKDINAQSVNYDTLRQNVDKYNKSVVNRIILEQMDIKEKKRAAVEARVARDNAEAQITINKALIKQAPHVFNPKNAELYYGSIEDKANEASKAILQQIDILEDSKGDTQFLDVMGRDDITTQQAALRGELKELDKAFRVLHKTESKLVKLRRDGRKATLEASDIMKVLGITEAEHNESISNNTNKTFELMDATSQLAEMEKDLQLTRSEADKAADKAYRKRLSENEKKALDVVKARAESASAVRVRGINTYKARKKAAGVDEIDIKRAVLNKELEFLKESLKAHTEHSAERIRLITAIQNKQNELAVNAINRTKQSTTVNIETKKTELSDMVGLASQASQLLAQGFESERQSRDDRMLQLSEQRNKELADENLTTSEKARINDRYNKKLGKMQEEQFKAQQESEATMITINTLLAISGTWAGYAKMGLAGTALATAQSIMLASLGKMQYDQVKSKKVPKFYQDGTRGQFNTPDYFMTYFNSLMVR